MYYQFIFLVVKRRRKADARKVKTSKARKRKC